MKFPSICGGEGSMRGVEWVERREEKGILILQARGLNEDEAI